MEALLERAAAMQERARRFLDELGLVRLWAQQGVHANLVGSLRSGLLIARRDIDLHLYSDPFRLAQGFAAMAAAAEDPRVRRLTYLDQRHAPDRCVEWHLWAEDADGEEWQIDMIHLLPDSPYVGVFEHVADRIRAALTDETRLAILALKQAAADHDRFVPGISIYQAVLAAGIRRYEDLLPWLAAQPSLAINPWQPDEIRA